MRPTHRLVLILLVLAVCVVVPTSASAAPSFLVTPGEFEQDRHVTFEWEASAGSLSVDCKLDDQPWFDCTSTNTAELTIATEGEHDFSVRDNEDPDPLATYTWTADYSPLAITTNLPQVIGTDPFDLEVTVNEPTTSLECRIDSEPWSDCDAIDFSLQVDGPHGLDVLAVDRAGNGTEEVFLFEVESEGPIVAIDSGPPTYLSSNHPVVFAFSSTDPAATFECSVNESAFAACTSPINVTGGQNRYNEFRVRAVKSGYPDQAPAYKEWSTLADPFFVYFESQPEGWTSARAAGFEAKVGGTARTDAAYTCSLDSAAFSPCSRFFEYSALDEGVHTVTVRATLDEVTKEATTSWTISDSPGTAFDGTPAEYSSEATARFDWNTFGDADGVECRLDSAAWALCTEADTAELTDMTEGEHTFEVRAFKGAVFQDPVSSFTWTVDTTPPTVTVGLPSVVTTNPFTVTINADEPLEGALCGLDTVDPLELVNCSGGLVLTGLTEGQHSLTVQATDRASNSATTQTISFNWKTATPDPPAGGGGGTPTAPVNPIVKPSLKKPSKPKGGSFTVPYTCGDATCKLSAKIKLGAKTIKLKDKTVRTGSGAAKFSLDSKAKKLLKKKGKAKATVTATITGSGGSTSSSVKY